MVKPPPTVAPDPLPSLPPESTSGDLKKSKAEVFRAIAKLLGVLTVALVPAIVGWIDAKSQATTALDATASEMAVNDKAYAKLVERLNKSEEDMRKVTIELAVLRELLRPPFARTSTTETIRPPSPKLSPKRPVVDRDEVDAAQQTIKKEF